MIKRLRKNIGSIIAILGLFILCIITFGDLGEFMSENYWKNVFSNLTSIGFLTVALSLIQVSIKQGLAEQALQSGLNTENTTKKYEEHRALITKNQSRIVFLPYFLQIYNKRHTVIKKREFLVDNNFSSETKLLSTGNKKLVRRYNDVKVLITASRIKWATTDIVHNKYGQIITLQEHRAQRLTRGIFMSFAFMLGVTLLTRGLFFEGTDIPLWQKFVKLFTYILMMGITSVLSIIREYEKGAFGVPNDLDEINEIWNEFTTWEIPAWVKAEIAEENEKEVKNECDTNLQDKQEESKIVLNTESDSVLLVADTSDNILCTDDKELNRKCD